MPSTSMTRAGVCAILNRYLELSDSISTQDHLSDVHRPRILLALEHDPEFQQMYLSLFTAAEFRSYYTGLMAAFGLDVRDLIPGAPALVATHATNVVDSSTMEERRQDDKRRVSLVIRENEDEIGAIWGSFQTMFRDLEIEPVEENRLRMVDEMEFLGIRWGICDARIESVQTWLDSKPELEEEMEMGDGGYNAGDEMEANHD
ncbi:hypothetical protein L873DRAFT_1788733 [Choiromyces venosus 120613-1]|uniref:Uncharacterized protein n=1 Tax=Choiromyces venosus 120613-1 TaxID=1336337 RepID=A0A3N4JRK4_9PEZI|nr:hypothetical protein L873DRAFT_1788733 [Choiromyces venosus 120613-1]